MVQPFGRTQQELYTCLVNLAPPSFNINYNYSHSEQLKPLFQIVPPLTIINFPYRANSPKM